MGKKLFSLCVAILIIAGLISCKAHTPEVIHPQFQPVDLDSKLKSGEYRQKANNFVAILDASRSSGDTEGDRTNFQRAKEFFYRMNQTLSDMTFKSTLRSFGQWRIASGAQSILHYGPTNWNRGDFQAALDAVAWGAGASPVDKAFDHSSEDMGSMRGHTAVILVGDGEYEGVDGVGAAKRMKDRYGNNACIYTVLAASETPEKVAMMKQIAAAGECGFYQNAMNLESPQAMADWVEAVFLEVAAAPLDSDGDGVYDNYDQCPDTPKGVAVDSKGCPLDSDGDGVYDYLDKCPDTPKGVTVDAKGCPLDSDGDGVYDYLDQCPNTLKGASVDTRGCWVIKGVNFDTAKWDIKLDSYRYLDEVTVILAKNPALKVEIQGHTDNQGLATYNRKLSERRAKAVMEYLVGKGISRNRLTAVGYGFSKPAASNDTPTGRAQNRRVELKPVW